MIQLEPIDTAILDGEYGEAARRSMELLMRYHRRTGDAEPANRDLWTPLSR